MPDITNPHDRFFKEVFSRPDVAEDFLFFFLPAHVTNLLQPGTFHLTQGSFVDPNLKEFYSDLLYLVDLKGEEQGFVYILLEHKSYPAEDIAFQLLRYMTRIWEFASKMAKGLPAVIPVVLYHGRYKWPVPLNFAALYRAPESLKENLLDFTYNVCDLSAHADEEIKLGVMARAALLLIKHIRRKDLARRLKDILLLLRAMKEQTALAFLETVLCYVGASAADTVTMDDCRKAVEAAFPEIGETFMDRWTEQLVEKHRHEWLRQGIEEGLIKGIKEGREEGREEGMRDAAASLTIRQLTRKLGNLDDGLRERVRRLSFEDLERLGEDLLDFQDVSALREWLEGIDKSR
ncbi:MAG: Rpn family recombination-promoting nuclease/putative transposase [Desulfomonilaceae bacterium]|nr:Rpn family recombination-promoting nuclease/putative transposase [Desulfomonilaceae bacterium]